MHYLIICHSNVVVYSPIENKHPIIFQAGGSHRWVSTGAAPRYKPSNSCSARCRSSSAPGGWPGRSAMFVHLRRGLTSKVFQRCLFGFFWRFFFPSDIANKIMFSGMCFLLALVLHQFRLESFFAKLPCWFSFMTWPFSMAKKLKPAKKKLGRMSSPIFNSK